MAEDNHTTTSSGQQHQHHQNDTTRTLSTPALFIPNPSSSNHSHSHPHPHPQPISAISPSPSGGGAGALTVWSTGVDGRTQRQRGPDGRFLPVEGQPETPMQGLLRQCSSLLNMMMNHKYGFVFNEPVDPEKLGIPDYFHIITNPMDFGTIKDKLRNNVYKNPEEFASDVRLTFRNALTYNPPGDQVHNMASMLSKLFESRWKDIDKRMDKLRARELKKTDGSISLPEISNEKKKTIIDAFLMWNDDIPDSIVEFIQTHDTSEVADENEMELDINSLNSDQLWKLFELVKKHLRAPKRAMHARPGRPGDVSAAPKLVGDVSYPGDVMETRENEK